ncbi:MAG TPA: peptide MFS transporter [Gemmatimonadaceae bacterium]
MDGANRIVSASPRLAAAATTADRPPTLDDRALFGHPRGLGLLFATEMWERFSYYGMRALLILYLVNALGWSTARAANLYGTYTGLVYFTPLIGGWLADRFIGTRRSLVLGGITIALGHFALAVPGMTMFYIGLALVVIGTGFFKPNVSTMVGQIYREGDARRDAGFTIFYMGINTGAFLGPIVCGYLAQTPGYGWHWGFGAAGVGMVLGLLLYVGLRERYLPGVGIGRPGGAGHATGAHAHAPAHTPDAGHAKTTSHGKDDAKRVLALLIVAVFVVCFWAGYDQAGSSMNLFADKHTRLALGSFQLRSSWLQSVPPMFVLLFAPVFAALWGVLRRRGLEPSTPRKMAFGLLLLGAGFAVLAVGARRADAGVLVSPLWLVGAYLLHVWGELCLSPVGLSYVTKVAPVRFASLLMGVWFVANGVADKIGGMVAALMDRIPSLASFFTIFLVSSCVAGVVMLLLVPLLRKLTQGAAE